MKTYTINEIDKIINDGSIVRVCLMNPQGKKILGWNTSKAKIKDWWRRIQKILNDPALEKGYYQIIMKRSSATDAAQELFEVKAGQRESRQQHREPERIPLQENNQERFDQLSNPVAMQFMQLNSELAELRAENRYLERDNARLSSELISSEAEILALNERIEDFREEKQQLSEMKQPSQLQSTLTAAMPLIDKYFENQDKRLALQEKELSKEAKEEAEKIAASIPEYVKRLVTPSTGEYFDVLKCDVSNFIAYFNSDEEINEFMQNLNAEHPENARILSNRVNKYIQEQKGGEQ